MAKRTFSTSLKGELSLDFNEGYGLVTEIVKDVEKTYDFFSVLQEYNGMQVAISITQVDNIKPMDDDELE